MRENVAHPLMQNGGNLIVKELRVGGWASIWELRNLVTCLEAVDQRVVHIENNVDAVLSEFGNHVIEPVPSFPVVVERGLAVARVQEFKTVHSRDVDTLASHAPHRVVGLLFL